MIALIAYLTAMVTTLGTGVLAGYSDFKGLKIPNSCHAVILGALLIALLALVVGGIEAFPGIRSRLIAAALIWAVTFVLFCLRMLGGGDSKLLTVFALWTGLPGLPVMLFYMGVFGACLGLTALVIRQRKPFSAPAEGGWIDRLQKGEKSVPYGIPVVLGAFMALWQMGYMNPDIWARFLG